MKLTLGFSPCPNDTFIFDALVHKKIDTEGLDFEVILADVEALNQGAFAGSLDITKLSYHAFGHAIDNYTLLDAGSALGNNCGPLLIAKDNIPLADIPNLRIGIPGTFTTANFLLSLAFPEALNRTPLLFSEIEEAVMDGRMDAGLIIHENRFTYEAKGLVKLIDLGAFWETQTGMPIPLGGIVIRRDIDPEIQHKVNRVLRRSVDFALDNPKQTLEYVRCHAQEMDEQVMFQHIGLYVNAYSRDLGQKGREAVHLLFEKANTLGLIPRSTKPICLT